MEKRYLDSGYVVIPVRADKSPSLPRWKGVKLEDCANMRFGTDAIGLLTGEINGIVVLDIDVSHDGLGYFKKEIMGSMPNDGPVSVTGGGGLHYFFAYNHETAVGNRYRLRKKGLDFKSDGGYVIVPPSIHSNGNKYRWKRSLFTHELPELPPLILKILKEPRNR